MPVGLFALHLRSRMWNTDGGGAGGLGSDSSGSEGDPNNTNDKTYTQDDVDNLQKALDAERKQRSDDAKNHKLTAKELKDLRDASKPEIERVTGERDALKTERDNAVKDLRELRAKAIVTDAARDAKARSANAVYALVASGLEYSDDGTPTNVAEMIAKVQKSDPDLFGEVVQGKGDGGAGDGTSITDDMNDWIRKAAKR